MALFEALVMTAVEHIDDFSPQGLANIAWAFGTVGQKNEPLFAAVAAAAQRRMADLNPQDLANIAWADIGGA